VLWLGQNSARVLEGILACARIEAIFCPANWRQSEAELAFVLEDVEPALVLWQQEEIGAGLESLQQRYESETQRWVQHDGNPNGYEKWLATPAQPLTVEADAGEPILMLYTAAFSGQPNGALLSQRAITSQNRNFATARGLSETSRYLSVGPLFHVATLLEALATFQAGGCNIFIRRADAADICRAVQQEHCNSAFLLPPIIEQIVEYAEQHTVDISSLVVLPGSAAWNQLITVDKSAWGQHPYGFGQTETFGYASYCMLAPEGIGTMGRAAPGIEIAILDEAGSVLPAGELGEIAVRGETIMNGYWRRPELNGQRRIDDWHRCNDLGRMESDGTLSFVGPKQRMIRSAQENIYPVEVENCLGSHPAVSSVAVIGVPDERWDQSVKAIVVLQPGQSCTADELIDHCRAQIASYKKPRTVIFADNLPTSGRSFDYDAIDKTYGGGGYPGSG
jgi:acyl-CoA synthetase (AMP-forming)/AMP-acid ligase II